MAYCIISGCHYAIINFSDVFVNKLFTLRDLELRLIHGHMQPEREREVCEAEGACKLWCCKPVKPHFLLQSHHSFLIKSWCLSQGLCTTPGMWRLLLLLILLDHLWDDWWLLSNSSSIIIAHVSPQLKITYPINPLLSTATNNKPCRLMVKTHAQCQEKPWCAVPPPSC